jgi:hypothetical protein
MLHRSGGSWHDTLGRHDTPRNIAAGPLRDSASLSCPGCVPGGDHRFRQRLLDEYGLAQVGLGLKERGRTVCIT